MLGEMNRCISVSPCLSDGITCLNDRITCLSDGITCLSDRITCLNDRITCLSDRITCLNDRITCLSDRITCLNDRITCLTTQHKTPLDGAFAAVWNSLRHSWYTPTGVRHHGCCRYVPSHHQPPCWLVYSQWTNNVREGSGGRQPGCSLSAFGLAVWPSIRPFRPRYHSTAHNIWWILFIFGTGIDLSKSMNPIYCRVSVFIF